VDFDPLELIGGALGRSVYELLRQRLVKEVPVASPAAGAEWSTVVPAGTTWELLSVQETLATSAVVANRVASVQVPDASAARVLRIAGGGLDAASLTTMETFAAGLGTTENVSHHQAPLPAPPAILPGGWQVGSLTTNIDVGDQYSAILVVVREWSTQNVQASLDWLIDTLRR
jgi:hypothetical protein